MTRTKDRSPGKRNPENPNQTLKSFCTKHSIDTLVRSSSGNSYSTFINLKKQPARRKQGGSQSTNDNAKGPAKSAGALLRRYGEQALKDVRV